jgi:hypothetical protein
VVAHEVLLAGEARQCSGLAEVCFSVTGALPETISYRTSAQSDAGI